MVRDLINKLKLKKQKVEILTINKKTQEYDESTIDIFISKSNDIYKMNISDYIKAPDYKKKLEETDSYGLYNLISMSVLWNTEKQMINKGLYYVAVIDEPFPYITSIKSLLYNILIGEKEIIIDERKALEDNTIEERIVRVNKNNYSDYQFTYFRHDESGNTIDTKYYLKDKYGLDEIELSEELTMEEILSIKIYLRNIKELNSINDIQNILKYIVDDLKNRSDSNKNKKYQLY